MKLSEVEQEIYNAALDAFKDYYTGDKIEYEHEYGYYLGLQRMAFLNKELTQERAKRIFDHAEMLMRRKYQKKEEGRR